MGGFSLKNILCFCTLYFFYWR